MKGSKKPLNKSTLKDDAQSQFMKDKLQKCGGVIQRLEPKNLNSQSKSKRMAVSRIQGLPDIEKVPSDKNKNFSTQKQTLIGCITSSILRLPSPEPYKQLSNYKSQYKRFLNGVDSTDSGKLNYISGRESENNPPRRELIEIIQSEDNQSDLLKNGHSTLNILLKKIIQSNYEKNWKIPNGIAHSVGLQKVYNPSDSLSSKSTYNFIKQYKKRNIFLNMEKH